MLKPRRPGIIGQGSVNLTGKCRMTDMLLIIVTFGVSSHRTKKCWLSPAQRCWAGISSAQLASATAQPMARMAALAIGGAGPTSHYFLGFRLQGEPLAGTMQGVRCCLCGVVLGCLSPPAFRGAHFFSWENLRVAPRTLPWPQPQQHDYLHSNSGGHGHRSYICAAGDICGW